MCDFIGNEASYGRGGAIASQGALILKNSTFTENKALSITISADYSTAGDGQSIVGQGGAIYADHKDGYWASNYPSSVKLHGLCTFVGNIAQKGGALSLESTALRSLECPAGKYTESRFFKSVDPFGIFDSNFTGCPSSCSLGKFAASMVTSRDESGCLPCPLGMFCSSLGCSECVHCPAGRYGISEGLTLSACSGACDPGHYCETGSTNSTSIACPAGRFVGKTGSQSHHNCTLCPVGHFCVSPSLFASPCPMGHYGNSSGLKSSFCSGLCPVGHFCGTQTVEPQQCAQGTYSNSLGGVTCTACPVGYAASERGQSSCSPCAAGKFTFTSRTVLCQDCTPGMFGSEEGMKKCNLCANGTYQDIPGSSSCKAPDAGNFVRQGGGQTVQLECVPGHYRKATDTSCLACPRGRFQNMSGQTSCSLCSRGRVATNNASTFCIECSPGQYSGANAQSCSDCAVGKFNPKYAQAKCTVCPSGLFSSVGARICGPASVNLSLPVPVIPKDAIVVKSSRMDEIMFLWSLDTLEPVATFQVQWSEILNFNTLVGSSLLTVSTNTTPFSITVPWPATQKVLYFRVRLASTTGSSFGSWSEPNSAWATVSTCLVTEYLHTRTKSPAASSFVCEECMEGAECDSRFSDNLGTLVGYWRPTFEELEFYSCIDGFSDCTGGTLLRNSTSPDVMCHRGHTGPLCAVCLPDHARDETVQCIACTASGNNTLRGAPALLIALGIIAVLTFLLRVSR